MGHRPKITVTRLDGQWRADGPPLRQSLSADTLAKLHVTLRTAVDLTRTSVEYRTGDRELDNLVDRIRADRERAAAATTRLRTMTAQLLAKTHGMPVRDVAVLLGTSHQLVSQLRIAQKAQTWTAINSSTTPGSQAE